MNIVTYPLNNIEYVAEDAELFNCTRGSGVWTGNSFTPSVTGADNSISIGTGVAWIHNTEFSGKVVALKDPVTLDLGTTDTLLPRIDVVALQFNATLNKSEIIVKKGSPGVRPKMPEISRSSSVYELYLASVLRTANSTTISAANVTDLRLNPTVCGLMADSVTSVDTSAIDAQIKGMIQALGAEIKGVKDTSGLMFRNEWVDSNGKIPAHKLSANGVDSTEFLKDLLFIGVTHLNMSNLEFNVVENKSFFIPGINMVVIDIGVKIDGAIAENAWVDVCEITTSLAKTSRIRPLNAEYAVVDGTKRFSAIINSKGVIKVCSRDGNGTNSNFTLNIAGVYVL